MSLRKAYQDHQLSRELPDIMQSFLRNGDTCDKIIAEVLQVWTPSQTQLLIDNSSLQLHNDILDKLSKHLCYTVSRRCLTGDMYVDHAQRETNDLQSLVMHLRDLVQLAASSPIHPIFAACLLVLHTRIANLTTAQSLVESSKDNLEMILQLENLQLSA